MQVYARANQGDYIEFAAPGVGVRVAAGRAAGSRSGTSFAVPFVTAAVAVTYGDVAATALSPGVAARFEAGARGPAAAEPSLRQRVVDNIHTKDLGRAGKDPVFGRGLVQAPGCTARSAEQSPEQTVR